MGHFGGCSKITGNISEKLLEKSLNVKDFGRTFCGCSRLTGDAPALWERTNITNGYACFSSCTGFSNYSQIPTGWK